MAYEINININGDVGGAKGVSKTSGQKEQEKLEKERAKAQKKLAGFVSSQAIQPFVNTIKSNVTSNIQIVTGNTDLQQRVNFAFEIAQFGQNTFQNIQAGGIIATGLGLSGLAGGAIGLALTAVNTGIQIYGNKKQIDLQERMENYQLQQTRERAGAMYNSSRR